MEKEGIEFLRVILSEYGLAVLVLIVGNVLQWWRYKAQRQDYKEQAAEYLKLYAAEKADRKEAWRAYNTLLRGITEVMGSTNEALIRLEVLVKERLNVRSHES